MADIIRQFTAKELLSALSNPPIPQSLKLLHDRVRHTLPTTIRTRTPPHLTLPELTEILAYKLTIGVNRPFLKSMLLKNTDSAVRAISARAFALPGLDGKDVQWAEVKKALETICELKGVGPALGSLVLAMVYPGGVAFFSDETAVELLRPTGGRKGLKYTMREYEVLWERLGEICEEVNGRSASGERVGRGDVGRAIWGYVREREGGGDGTVVKAEKEGKEEKSQKRKRVDGDKVDEPEKKLKRTRSKKQT